MLKKKFFYLLSFILIAVVLEFSSDLLIRQHNFLIKIFGNSDIFWETYFLNSHKSGTVDNTTCFTYDSALGWKSKNSCTNLKNGVTFKTDSLGLRHIPYHSASSKNKILFIGDSFTEGAEVSDSFAFPALLQKIRPDLKIYNSGVGGYSHSQMILLLKGRIQQLQPTQVVLGFVNDDVSRNQLVFNGFAKPGYSVYDGKLALKNKNVKTPEEILDEHPFRSSAFLLLRFLISHKKPYSSADDIEVTKHILYEMNKICQQSDIDFKVVLIPTGAMLKKLTINKIFEPFENYFRINNIPYYSIEPIYKDAGNITENTMPGGHWDVKANFLIAKTISATGCLDSGAKQFFGKGN